MTTTLEQPRLVRTGTLGPLSESIIKAIPGKFYAYQSVFTDQKPLYGLLDCKANKSRALEHADELGREVHLYFEFSGTTHTRVFSIKTAQNNGLFGPINAEFDDVWVAPTHIAIEDFYTLCAQRNSEKLEDICKVACLKHEVVVDVVRGTIIAVMTSADKFGLFLPTKIESRSLNIDACHILLP